MKQEGAVRIDVGRQLFVDDALISHTTLQRSFHKPRIHPASPVLQPETDIEKNGGVMPCATIASVLYDPQDQLYKAWYMAGYDDGFGYATSKDGITWVRPSLDVVPGTNRVIAPMPGYIRSGATVWLDHDPAHRNERFRMFAFWRVGTGSWPRKLPEPVPGQHEIAFVFASPDGIHWTKRGQAGPCGDNTSFFRNPFRGVWAFSIRTFRGVLGRGRAYHEHADFMQAASWKKGEDAHWLATDERDRPDPVLQLRPELYKMDAAPYESLMVGLFGIYYGPPNHVVFDENIPKTVDLHLGFSRDGLHWDRPDRNAFIACSRQEGSWDRGYLQPSAGICLVVGDELRFYFSAFSGVSPAQGKGTYAGGSIALATMRRDGFASMDGPGMPMPPIASHGDRVEVDRRELLPPGSLTTVPVVFSGSHLFVNAKLHGGELLVEVLRADGSAIEGFSTRDCHPVTGDSTRHAVAWPVSLAALTGTPVCFRFHLDAGELYSFWVSQDVAGRSGGYVGAGGPDFTGERDL